jgi:hypothetical protein
MESLPNVAETIRKTTEAYSQALATAMSFLATAPKVEPPASAAVEQWLRLARMTKDGLVMAIEQGFQLWEREYRRATTGAGTAPAPPAANPVEVWAENWRTTLDSLTAAARPADPWAEQAKRQAELMQKTLQEGLAAWQRLWPPTTRTS